MSKNPTSEGRYRKRINDQDAECVNNIIKELDNYFKQYNGVPDTNIGNILTYNFDESNVQPHQDDYDAIQLRINIMIEKDDSGNPVINGFLYKITQSGGWAFSPSSAMHGSTKVKTAIRINLSMGWNFKNTEDYNNAFISLSS